MDPGSLSKEESGEEEEAGPECAQPTCLNNQCLLHCLQPRHFQLSRTYVLEVSSATSPCCGSQENFCLEVFHIKPGSEHTKMQEYDNWHRSTGYLQCMQGCVCERKIALKSGASALFCLSTIERKVYFLKCVTCNFPGSSSQ